MTEEVRAAREAVLTSSGRFWSAGDLLVHGRLLAELARAGELVRVRPGLYWRGRRTRLGMSPPPPEELIGRLAS
jgi:hypothetical protein